MATVRTKTGRVPMREIRKVVAQIVEQWHPEKVILFGSHAYGKPTEDSDVDLLVIMPVEGSALRKAGDIRATLDLEFPMDLLVYSPERVRERLAIDDLFLKHWLTKGVTLHEAAHC